MISVTIKELDPISIYLLMSGHFFFFFEFLVLVFNRSNNALLRKSSLFGLNKSLSQTVLKTHSTDIVYVCCYVSLLNVAFYSESELPWQLGDADSMRHGFLQSPICDASEATTLLC